MWMQCSLQQMSTWWQHTTLITSGPASSILCLLEARITSATRTTMSSNQIDTTRLCLEHDITVPFSQKSFYSFLIALDLLERVIYGSLYQDARDRTLVVADKVD